MFLDLLSIWLSDTLLITGKWVHVSNSYVKKKKKKKEINYEAMASLVIGEELRSLGIYHEKVGEHNPTE